jgi:hypothetical protein
MKIIINGRRIKIRGVSVYNLQEEAPRTYKPRLSRETKERLSWMRVGTTHVPAAKWVKGLTPTEAIVNGKMTRVK